MAIKLVISCVKTVFLILLSFGVVAMVPIYKFFYTDEKELLVPFLFPFTEIETQFGYYLNMAFQSMYGIFAAVMLLSTEIAICMLKNNGAIATVIIKNELMQLKNQLEMDDEFTDEHNWTFRNIILQVLDLNRFALISITISIKIFCTNTAQYLN